MFTSIKGWIFLIEIVRKLRILFIFFTNLYQGVPIIVEDAVCTQAIQCNVPSLGGNGSAPLGS